MGHREIMQAIDVGFLGLMGILAAIDYKTFRIPLWGLFLLGAMAIICHFFSLYSLIDGFMRGLLLMGVSVIAGDFLMKRETIGGGDIWIGATMSAFMGFDRFLVAYIFAALLGALAFVTIHRKFKNIDIAYVPYLAVGALFAMVVI